MSPFLGQMNEYYVALLQAFFKAVDALNRQDMTDVAKLLHDDIVLNKIHDQLGTLKGKQTVVDYLGSKVKGDRPSLMPISPISIDCRTGTVSGLAIWEDHKASGDIRELIDYSFAFTWAGDRGWRIHNMYASRH